MVEGRQDLDLAVGVVWLDIVSFCDDFESYKVGFVHFGDEAAGNVVTVLVLSYCDTGTWGVDWFSMRGW